MDSIPLELLEAELQPKEPTFYLYKHKDLSGLLLPLKGSQRVKVSSEIFVCVVVRKIEIEH